MTSPFLHFYLSKSQNRRKLVAKFTILLQENHENCQEFHFIHLQYSFQWHKLDECTCPMKNTGCHLLTYIQQVYRTATGLLTEYCTAATPAGRIHQSFLLQCRVQHPTKHIIGHIGDGFLGDSLKSKHDGSKNLLCNFHYLNSVSCCRHIRVL